MTNPPGLFEGEEMKFTENSQDSKNRLSLKNGDSVKGVFRGEPVSYKAHWETNKLSICRGSECEKCATGNKPSFRFKINIVVKENECYVAKVWEQGWTTYQVLKSLHEGGYDLEKFIMKVSRSGSNKNDTVYSVLPVPDGKLNDKQIEEINKVVLNPISIN